MNAVQAVCCQAVPVQQAGTWALFVCKNTYATWVLQPSLTLNDTMQATTSGPTAVLFTTVSFTTLSDSVVHNSVLHSSVVHNSIVHNNVVHNSVVHNMLTLQVNEGMFDEQDLTQFLGQAEDAQAAAEQGWNEALQDVDILRAFIAANNLEVPDCHTQFYNCDAEVGFSGFPPCKRCNT